MEPRDEAQTRTKTDAITTEAAPGVRPGWLHKAVTTIEEATRLDEGIARLRGLSEPLTRPPAGPVLRGEWLGHAVHPLLTDFPLGCWTAAGILDLVGGRGSQHAAQRLIGAGLLGVPATAATGVSDWSTLRDPRTRRVGFVHAVGNAAVAFLYYRSWRARRHGSHGRGVALGMLGAAGACATGYLGGYMAFGGHAGEESKGHTTDDRGERSGPREVTTDDAARLVFGTMG